MNLFLLLVTAVVLTPWSWVLADNCNEAWIWYEEGLALFDNSDREAFYYQRAVELCPEFVEAHNSLGRVYQNQGKYELSIKEFKQARIQALSSDIFSSRPGSRDLFLEPIISLGEIYRLQGKYELAAAEFARALEIYPDSLAAQNNLQYIYKRLHRYDSVLSPRNRLLTNGIFTRIPGTTLPKGGFLFDLQYRYWEQTAPLTRDMFDSELVWLFVGPQERNTRIQLGILGIRYGLTNDLTLGLISRYFSRELEIQLGGMGMQEVKARPSVKGLSDLQFLIKYRLWGQRKNHLALYNLLTIPVGKEKIATADEKIWTFGRFDNVRRRVPMGSGSYDFTPGIAFTAFLDPAILHSNIQYRITDGELIGDEFRADFGLIYPLNNSVNATIETSYRWRGDTKQKQRIYVMLLRPDYVGPFFFPAGPVEIDTTFTEKGGDSFFLSPGLQFTVAKGLKLEAGVKIPIIKQAEGWAEDVIFHVGMVKIMF